MQKPTATSIFSYGKIAQRGKDCIVVYPKQENDLWFDQHFENENLDLLRSMVKEAASFRIEIIPEGRIVFSFFHNNEEEKTIQVFDAEQKQKTLSEIQIARGEALLKCKNVESLQEFNDIFAGTDFGDPEDVRERAEEWFSTMPPAFKGSPKELREKINEWNALKFFAFDFYSHFPIGEIDVTDFNERDGIGCVECSILTDKLFSVELKGNSKLRFERMLDACNGFLFEGNSSRKIDSCLNLVAFIG